MFIFVEVWGGRSSGKGKSLHCDCELVKRYPSQALRFPNNWKIRGFIGQFDIFVWTLGFPLLTSYTTMYMYSIISHKMITLAHYVVCQHVKPVNLSM